MPLYTPEELRTQLLNPLTTLLSEFSEGIARMEVLRNAGKLPDGKLPLRAIGAIDAISTMKALRFELLGKLEGATDGRLERMESKRLLMQKRRSGKNVKLPTKR